VSAIPIPEMGLLPLQKPSKAPWSRRSLVRQVAAHLRRDVWNVPGYVLRYSVLVMALFGVAGLWDACGDGKLPALLPLRDINPHRRSSLPCTALRTSDAARWAGLTPALAILDEVNPTVAAWIRQEHARGSIVFSDRYCGSQGNCDVMAKYDHVKGGLLIYRALFAEDDGTVAAILCHEFRHSRQNSAKVLRYALSTLLAAHGDASVVENDAELYEHEARVAIFGHN
jgi:hypothetical protein